MSDFPQPISQEIWDLKYRLKPAGVETHEDLTVQDTWKRVAVALAQAEENPAQWVQPFYEALEDFKFLPAGRIIAGAGTARNVTLFNCYVMGTIPDSLDGIFEHLKEAALTMQQGGGIGYDFSTLRPKGALVRGVGSDASGPLSFMDVWDAMCKTIMSAGTRRGAMMATMHCRHPDIEAFIEAKSDPARLRMFNVSVLCTDEFMEAVEADAKWTLEFEGEPYREVQARDLWDKIMRATYAQAEPGVIFIDRINQTNNLNYCEKIAATNPCGEQPLPPYGACLLGSINLAKFILRPFSKVAAVDYNELRRIVGLAVRMLDNVVDISKFPLIDQEEEAKLKRRIGLGVTGLADAIAMLGMKYSSKEARDYVERVMKVIQDKAYTTSVYLAREKGAFPAFRAEGYLAEGTHASTLDEQLQAMIEEFGIRNSHLLSIAPTGTISLYAGNVSSGVEPIFAVGYKRKVTQPGGSKTEQMVRDYAVHLYNEEWGYNLPDYFETAQDLEPMAHVHMQASVQKFIDSSISKTINVPEDIDFDAFKDVYLTAWKLGCKGCTTYRPNDVTGSVIEVTEDHPEAEVLEEPVYVDPGPLLDRPREVSGTTYKLAWPGEEPFTLYVTVNDIAGQPFEVFIASKNVQHFAWTSALTRMISAVFRRGGDVAFVAKELQEVFDPAGGAWVDRKYQPSVLALIGDTLEAHFRKIGYIHDGGVTDTVGPTEEEVAVELPKLKNILGPKCPKCGSHNLKVESGCKTCLECGHSKCG